MDYRRLGHSGFKVPVLSFGTGTFGGAGGLASWGGTKGEEAQRLVDICIDAGRTSIRADWRKRFSGKR